MKEILQFLKELSANNNREWFAEHKDRYVECNRHFLDFCAQYLRRLSAEVDPDLAVLQPKDCVWRIYRDIRFSPDKRPYKEYFGCCPAAGVPGQPKTWGRKSMRGCYYVHIQPGQCAFSGGIWDPGKELLKALRTEIEANYEEVEEINREICAPDFMDYLIDIAKAAKPMNDFLNYTFEEYGEFPSHC